jgi:hypothetical protein
MRWRGFLSVATSLVLAAGCGDNKPQGPGNLQGSVEVGATAIGAVVVNVSGVGIGAIKGVGSTRAFASDAVANSKRVVLVTERSGALNFTVHVEDRSAAAPSATVVEAIDLNNQQIGNLGAISVRITVQ